MAAEDLVGAGASSVLNFIGGLVNTGVGASLTKKQIQAQKDINQQNIDLAHEQMNWSNEQMDKQNQWNLDQWNRENAYNDPAAQIDRLRKAGLNPLFFGLDGNGNGAHLESASPSGYSLPNLRNPYADVDPLMAAQIANINADTQRKKSDTKLNDIEAGYKAELLKGQVSLLGVDIDLSRSRKRLNDAEIDKIAVDCAKIQSESDNLVMDLRTKIHALDINERAQKLSEQKFEFEKWLDSVRLSQSEREIAIHAYNSVTSRVAADSQVALNDATIALTSQKTETERHNTAIFGTEEYYRSQTVSTDITKREKELKGQKIDNTFKVINGVMSFIKDGADAATSIVGAPLKFKRK